MSAVSASSATRTLDEQDRRLAVDPRPEELRPDVLFGAERTEVRRDTDDLVHPVANSQTLLQWIHRRQVLVHERAVHHDHAVARAAARDDVIRGDRAARHGQHTEDLEIAGEEIRRVGRDVLTRRERRLADDVK